MATLPSDWLPPAELRGDPNPGFVRAILHAGYDVAWVLATLLGMPWLAYRTLRRRAFGSMVLERVGRGLGSIPPATRPRVLVHGVSVGEVKAALPVVRALAERHPELEVVVSTTTDTGLEVARTLFPENRVVRFPVDASLIVGRFVRRVDPALVLLVELEIWPNFLRICNRLGRPVAVVNGRITEWSHGYYLFSRNILPQFNRISLFCVQLEAYAQRFRKLHVEPERILVTGNVKVDGLPVGRVDPGEELTRLLAPKRDRAVVVAGSTHEPEERLIARAWEASFPSAGLVLVPRHPNRTNDVVSGLRADGFRVQRLSELRAGAAPDESAITLVDTIGELERVYGLADVVFVGGSLVPHGGQNMLEPAAQGRAVLFGPHVANFAQEASLLLLQGASEQVESADELGASVARLLAEPERAQRMGAAAMAAVRDQGGATDETLAALERLSIDRIVRESGQGTRGRPLAASRLGG